MVGIQLLDAKVPKGDRIFAIGDIHGCLGEFNQLMSMIKSDQQTSPEKRSHLVFLGDYFDRGPDCKGVLERLLGIQNSNVEATFLMGNHEEKFLHFLENPVASAEGFFTYGGTETVKSYGFTDEELYDPMVNAARIRDLLLERLPQSHMVFLRKLTVSRSFGDYFFCHAGIRPNVELNNQSNRDLMWIRQEFTTSPQLHPKIIVHGHTPHYEPEVLPNRINVDTKCYETGVLTCLVLEDRTHRFLQTGEIKD